MMNKIPVYFMPGLAASAEIFERIVLPEAIFEIFLLHVNNFLAKKFMLIFYE